MELIITFPTLNIYAWSKKKDLVLILAYITCFYYVLCGGVGRKKEEDKYKIESIFTT